METYNLSYPWDDYLSLSPCLFPYTQHEYSFSTLIITYTHIHIYVSHMRVNMLICTVMQMFLSAKRFRQPNVFVGQFLKKNLNNLFA